MQKVEMYYNMLKAKQDMTSHIENGWRIHTCTMGCYVAANTRDCYKEKVLVIYEK